MKTQAAPRLPYMPGLDGLRAVAVLAVFFYHAGFLWAKGGFLGVESFFVVSGYLITALLLQEYRLTGGIVLPRFWLRRARRLLPALWLLLFGVLLLAAAFAPDAWPRLREDLLGALLYLTNWVYVFRQIPYFESFGRPPLLRHLWSLAVEEQFYLLWPLLLLFLLRRRRGSLLPPILGLIALSAGLMALRYQPASDPARLYYGTDTRAAGFLAGAALAVLWPPASRGREALVNLGGLLGLGGLLILFARLDEFTPHLYRGGFLLTAALTALVIAAAARPRGLLGQILGIPPLRWVGTRSYAIYLWHWPLMAVYRYGYECSLSPWNCALLHLALSLLLAEASYRLVENPIRRQGFRAWKDAAQRRLGVWGSRLALVGVLALAAGSAAALQRAAPPQGHASALESPAPTPSQVPAPSPTRGNPPAAATELPLTAPPSASPPAPIPREEGTATPTASPTPTVSPLQLTLIGDSIMESTLPLWEETLPPGAFVLDAHRSRKMSDLLEIIPALASEGRLAPQVVIHIGTNRPFEASTFDEVMETLTSHGVRRVLFVNVHRPVAWEYTVNKRLEEGAARWPQAEILDWHALSAPHKYWFVEDKTHLTFSGSQAYVEAILEAVGEISLPEAASP